MMIEISDIEVSELDVYARFSEVELLRIYEPASGMFIAESPNVIERALHAGYEPVSFLVNQNEMKKAEKLFGAYPEIPAYIASEEVFQKLTGFAMTRGLLCAMRRKALPDMRSILKDKKRIVVLENVMNPTNVGAIFRSAAALGMEAVLLTKGCSDPLYRRAARVSMGTVFQIPWTFVDKSVDWESEGISVLQEMGFKTVAMALREDSVGIDDKKLLAEEKLAVIMGTEGEGLADATISNCDYTVMIPMSHGVDSLNVAAASAVAFWQLGIHTS